MEKKGKKGEKMEKNKTKDPQKFADCFYVHPEQNEEHHGHGDLRASVRRVP